MFARCKRLDQRFPAGPELEYKKSLESEIAIFLYVAFVLSLLGAAADLESLATPAFDDPVYVALLARRASMFAVYTLTVLLAFFRKWLARRICHVDLEYVALAWFFAVGGAAPISGEHFEIMFGRKASQVESELPIDARVWTIAVFSIVMVAIPLVPIRWHFRLPLSLWMVGVAGTLIFSSLPENRRNYGAYSVFFIYMNAFSIYGSFRNEAHLRKEWLAERKVDKQKKSLEQQVDAFSQLLRRLCDCLFQLGPDLKIMNPCPNLTAMLLLSHGRPEQGCCFTDYLASQSDKDLFTAAINRSSADASSSGLLPLHLRAVQNQEIQVHVYYVSFLDQDDSPYHIIGIVEAQAQVKPYQDAPVNAPLTNLALCCGDTLASVSTPSTSEESIALEHVSGLDLTAVSFTIDDDLEIITCAPAFTRLFGPIADRTDFSGWLDDSSGFPAYVQELGNHFMNTFSEKLILRLPNEDEDGFEYVAKSCSLCSMNLSYEDLSRARLNLQFVLKHIKKRRKRRTSQQISARPSFSL